MNEIKEVHESTLISFSNIVLKEPPYVLERMGTVLGIEKRADESTEQFRGKIRVAIMKELDTRNPTRDPYPAHPLSSPSSKGYQSYAMRMDETKRENLDVRILQAAKRHGTRDLATMQWTIDNHSFFQMVYEILDTEMKIRNQDLREVLVQNGMA